MDKKMDQKHILGAFTPPQSAALVFQINKLHIGGFSQMPQLHHKSF